MTNTPEQIIADLLALGEKATEGEWESEWLYHLIRFSKKQSGPWDDIDGEFYLCSPQEDAAFIAASKNALPAIRDALTRLAAYEEAVGELVPALEAVSIVFRAHPEITEPLARLRALQEK